MSKKAEFLPTGELRWETSRGKPPTLADIVKRVRKQFPRVAFDRIEITATGFEGPDVFYRAVLARSKTK